MLLILILVILLLILVDLSSWEQKISENAAYVLEDDEDNESEDEKCDEAAGTNENELLDLEAYEQAAHPKYKNGILTIGCLGNV